MAGKALDQDQQPFDWRSHLAILRGGDGSYCSVLCRMAGRLDGELVAAFDLSLRDSHLVEQPTVPQQFVVPNIAGELAGTLAEYYGSKFSAAPGCCISLKA